MKPIPLKNLTQEIMSLWKLETVGPTRIIIGIIHIPMEAGAGGG